MSVTLKLEHILHIALGDDEQRSILRVAVERETGCIFFGSRAMASLLGKAYFRNVSSSDFNFVLKHGFIKSPFELAVKGWVDQFKKRGEPPQLTRIINDKSTIIAPVLATRPPGAVIFHGDSRKGQPIFMIAESFENGQVIRILTGEHSSIFPGIFESAMKVESVSGPISIASPEWHMRWHMSRIFGSSHWVSQAGSGKVEFVTGDLGSSVRYLPDLWAVARFIGKAAYNANKRELGQRFESFSDMIRNKYEEENRNGFAEIQKDYLA